MYGYARAEDLPLSENAPLRPNSPYAVSKLAQDFMGLQYFLDRKMPIIRVRPFNHIGPRQNERFVAPSFAKQIVEIERGRREPVLRLGNMTAQRDFTDVRDMVRAYILAIQKGEPGDVYNIGIGAGAIGAGDARHHAGALLRSKSPKRSIRPNSGRATRRSRTPIHRSSSGRPAGSRAFRSSRRAWIF